MSSVTSSTSTSLTTGMTGAGGGDLIRITGTETGLDVDSIVKKMMASEQTKIDKVKQQQQLLQWKQDAYKDIISSVKDFQSTYFDPLNSDTYVLSSNFFSSYSVTPSDATIATAAAGVGAKAGTYSISFGSDGHMAAAAVKNGSALNTSQDFVASHWSNSYINISINGGSDNTISLGNVSDITGAVDSINSQINSNNNLKGKVKAAAVNGKIQFQTLNDDYKVKISSTTVNTDLNNLSGKILNPSASTTMTNLGLLSDGSLKLTCNGSDYTIAVKTTDTLSDVINNINTATNGAVTGTYSQLTNSFTLKTTSTGSTQSLKVSSDSSSNVLGALGITSDATAISGTDALVYITPPGSTSATAVTKSSNTFTVDGITYNLLKQSDSTFTVTQDADKLYKKIGDFIDKYNSVIDKIQTKLTEKNDDNTTYAPLTDAQKSQMSESQISAWEAKAKVGILRNDDNLQSILDNLRSAFNTAVSGNIISFGKYGTNALGIDTYDDYSQGGKIYIADKSKLMDAINNHSDQLSLFFNQTSDLTDKTQKYNAEGAFTRIKDILDDNVGYTGTSLNSAILTKYANFQDDYSIYGSGSNNTIPDQIYHQKQALDKLNDEYSDMQEKYYQQFSALESAMVSLNSQSSWLSSMLG